MAAPNATLLKPSPDAGPGYRGRLAPSPTGYLHLGHARTFWEAQTRARAANGILVLRNDDLDAARARKEFVTAMFEDLRWFGFNWQEGPDCGGEYGPYNQSERLDHYREIFARLKEGGFIYPCTCSRQDVLRAASAPHPEDDEPIYPGTCRPDRGKDSAIPRAAPETGRANWRFRVPDGETIWFDDLNLGRQRFIAGSDFGDFVVWRHDGVPSYQLATVVDDAAMRITEVVRGADLLRSTARQSLIYRALEWKPPGFFHCPMVTDDMGIRLAKRNDALSLRRLRLDGLPPDDLRAKWSRSAEDQPEISRRKNPSAPEERANRRGP